MSKKYNKVFIVLSYIYQFRTLFSAIAIGISGFIFSSLVGIPVGVSKD